MPTIEGNEYIDYFPPDGRRLVVGSPEHNKRYYLGGEAHALGDLSNYSTTLRRPKDYAEYCNKLYTLPDIRTFIGVLQLIATEQDNLYSPETREKVQEILSGHETVIEKLAEIKTATPELLTSLKPIADKWGQFCLDKFFPE